MNKLRTGSVLGLNRKTLLRLRDGEGVAWHGCQASSRGFVAPRGGLELLSKDSRIGTVSSSLPRNTLALLSRQPLLLPQHRPNSLSYSSLPHLRFFSSSSSSSSSTSGSSTSFNPSIPLSLVAIVISGSVLLYLIYDAANSDPLLWSFISIPHCADSYLHLADQHIRRDDLDQAEAVLRSALDAFENRLGVSEASPEVTQLRIRLAKTMTLAAFVSAAQRAQPSNSTSTAEAQQNTNDGKGSVVVSKLMDEKLRQQQQKPLAPSEEDIEHVRAAWDLLVKKPFVGEAVKEEAARLAAAIEIAQLLSILYRSRTMLNEAARALKWCIDSINSPPGYVGRTGRFNPDPKENSLLNACIEGYTQVRSSLLQQPKSTLPPSKRS